MKINERLISNIIGGLAISLAIIFPEPMTITSWDLFFQSLVDFISNPYLIGLSMIGTWGYLRNYLKK